MSSFHWKYIPGLGWGDGAGFFRTSAAGVKKGKSSPSRAVPATFQFSTKLIHVINLKASSNLRSMKKASRVSVLNVTENGVRRAETNIINNSL